MTWVRNTCQFPVNKTATLRSTNSQQEGGGHSRGPACGSQQPQKGSHAAPAEEVRESQLERPHRVSQMGIALLVAMLGKGRAQSLTMVDTGLWAWPHLQASERSWGSLLLPLLCGLQRAFAPPLSRVPLSKASNTPLGSKKSEIN